MVFVDLLRDEVAMEIENRHFGGVVAVEFLRELAVQEEVVSQKLFHGVLLFL